MKKEPGDWYGVNSIAQVINQIFMENEDKGRGSHIVSDNLGFMTF